jgi:hypothetical protein
MAVTNIVYNSKTVMVNTNNALVAPVAEVFLTNNGFSPFTVNGLIGLTTVADWRSGLAVSAATNVLGTAGYYPVFKGTGYVGNGRIWELDSTSVGFIPSVEALSTVVAASKWAQTRTNDGIFRAFGKGTNWFQYNAITHDGTNSIGLWAGGDYKFQTYLGTFADRLIIGSAGSVSVPGGGLHVGGTSDPGDNNLLVDGAATVSGLTTANDSLTVRNYLISHEYGSTAQSTPYGLAGITRLATYTYPISYIALVRENNQIWGLGIGTNNEMVIGNPTATTHAISNPDITISATHSVTIASNLYVNGFINFTNGVWDDLMIPGHGVKGGASAPSFATFSTYGNMAYLFAGNQDNDVYFSAQLPHSYMEGSSVVPHVHWAEGGTTGAGTNVVWELVTQWANMGALFPAGSTNYITNSITGTNWVHQISSFPALSGTGKTVSSMIMCRLRRLASANASDDYNQYAAFLQFDFHIRKDTLGSRTETAK